MVKGKKKNFTSVNSSVTGNNYQLFEDRGAAKDGTQDPLVQSRA